MFLGDDKGAWPICTDHNGNREGTCNTNHSPDWDAHDGDAYGDGLYCCGVAPVLPALQLPDSGWYDIDSLDATTRSQIAHGTTLTFTQLRERGQVLPQGDYQIWYGEALTGHTTSDNGGESCVDVYVCGARQQLVLATVSLPHQIVCPVNETGGVQVSWLDHRKPLSRSFALSFSLYLLALFGVVVSLFFLFS